MFHSTVYKKFFDGTIGYEDIVIIRAASCYVDGDMHSNIRNYDNIICACAIFRPCKTRTLLRTNFMVTPCINSTEHFLLPTDAYNVKKLRVIKTF